MEASGRNVGEASVERSQISQRGYRSPELFPVKLCQEEKSVKVLEGFT